jgi:hypothetical protein
MKAAEMITESQMTWEEDTNQLARPTWSLRPSKLLQHDHKVPMKVAMSQEELSKELASTFYTLEPSDCENR